jgi:hypothetical protein
MVKLVILLLTGPFIEFEVSVFERKSFVLLRNIRKIGGTFKSVRSMVFDPSEFKGPRFDCLDIIFH